MGWATGWMGDASWNGELDEWGMPVQDLWWRSIGLEWKPNSSLCPANSTLMWSCFQIAPPATVLLFLCNHRVPHCVSRYPGLQSPSECCILVDVSTWNPLPHSLHSWLLVTTWISSHIIFSTVSSLPWCSHVMWPKATSSVLHHFIYFPRKTSHQYLKRFFFFFFPICCRHISSLCSFIEVQFQEKGHHVSPLSRPVYKDHNMIGAS